MRQSTGLSQQLITKRATPRLSWKVTQTFNQQLNSSHLSGQEGGPCPRRKLESHSLSDKTLNLANLTGQEGGPCPRRKVESPSLSFQ